MSCTKSPVWLHRAVSFLLVWSVACPPLAIQAQNGAEAEIRVLIERYSAAHKKRDLAGLTSLWSEKSPELAAARQTYQQMLIANSMIQIESLAVRKVTLEGDKATARIVFEISAINAKTGKPAEGFGKKNRTLQLVNESGVWRVWREVSSEAELAAAISAAKTDEERKVLLEADKELITVESQTTLLNQADSIVTRGLHEGALPQFQLALLIAGERGDKTGIATALRGIGKVHYLQGKAAKALEYFDQSLRISEELGDKRGFARTLNNIGNVHQSQARYKLALEYYERTLTISQETGDRLASANVLNNIGVVCQEQGNYVEALEYYQKSLNTKEGIADGVVTARTLNNMGGTYQSMGRLAQALEHYEKSLTFSEEADDKNAVAKTLNDIGNVHQILGNNSQALKYYQSSLKVSLDLRDRIGAAGALNNLGRIHQLQGNYTEALEYYQASLKIKQGLIDPVATATTLNNIGSIHQLQGNYRAAVEQYQESLKISQGWRDKNGIARTLNNIGVIQQSQGNFTQALDCFQKSLTISREQRDKDGTARALNSIGNVHQLQGNYAQALDHYDQSLKINEQSEDKNGISVALHNVASIHQLQGNFTRARELFLKSLQISEEVGARSAKATTLHNLGLINQAEGNYAQALVHFEKSLTISEQMGNRSGAAIALNSIGNIHRSRGNYPQSLDYYQRSLKLSQDLGDRSEAAIALNEIGIVHKSQGNTEQAEKAFIDAIAAIEQLRNQVAGGEQQRHQFFETRVSPYYAMVDLLIGANPARALAFAERAKARALLDVLQSGRITVTRAMTIQEQQQERKLNLDLVSLNTQIYRENSRDQPDQPRLNDLTARLKDTRLQIEAFQTSLYAAHPELKIHRGEIQPITMKDSASLIPDANTALLEYVVTEDKTHLFALTRHRRTSQELLDLKVFTFVLKKKDLAERVEQFRTSLGNRDFTADELGRDLYNLLLEPASAALQGKTSLVIVPDGVLWDLPFQALQPKKDRYLIENSALSYAPSLTALREMVKPRRKSTSGTAGLLLAFGNPSIGRETVQREKSVFMDERLEPLPEAEHQVKVLEQLYGANRSKVYVQTDAKEERLKAEAGNYRILHLATHGILNDNGPMYSHVLLSQAEAGSKEDGILEAWEMINLDMNADLVVLSACETARGRVQAGEGVIGLTWALFVAGCPTTVASQWKVEVQSTTELMLEFHRNMKSQIENPKSKMTKAEALRQASLKLLRTSKYRHPFYWAGFVIVGNGR